MRIDIDSGSGFCFGVVTAIRKAEEELAKGNGLYCLGDIVHNGKEMDRLRKLGLITIDYERFKQLHDVKVLLRAHGEPPETYRVARRNNIEIIDATCPVVLRLQKRIKQSYLENSDNQTVIYGKNGHAEVLGLVGQTNGEAVVIEQPDQAGRLDMGRNIRLFSQTTNSVEGFGQIVDYIKRHISPSADFVYYDTICRQVANRIPRLRAFALAHDLVLFVSGKKSSNGRVLFEECVSVNPNSYLIDSQEDIDPSWIRNIRSVGICGATSTPKWLMERVRDALTQLALTTP